MNEKIKYIIFSIILCIGLSSCCTTKSANDVIGTNQRDFGKLESTVDELTDTIDRSDEQLELIKRTSEELERTSNRLEDTVNSLTTTIDNTQEGINTITRTSENIDDSIERLIYLFGQYESIVTDLLSEITRIRDEAQTQSKDNPNIGNN